MAFALGAMFCIPGTLWLIIESRWKEAAVLAVPAVGATAQEDVLEDRLR